MRYRYHKFSLYFIFFLNPPHGVHIVISGERETKIYSKDEHSFHEVELHNST